MSSRWRPCRTRAQGGGSLGTSCRWLKTTVTQSQVGRRAHDLQRVKDTWQDNCTSHVSTEIEWQRNSREFGGNAGARMCEEALPQELLQSSMRGYGSLRACCHVGGLQGEEK